MTRGQPERRLTGQKEYADWILQANEPLTLTEKPLPVPECGELLVKIKAVSICASDFVPWKGYLGPVDGLVAGHEGVGIVVGSTYDDLHRYSRRRNGCDADVACSQWAGQYQVFRSVTELGSPTRLGLVQSVIHAEVGLRSPTTILANRRWCSAFSSRPRSILFYGQKKPRFWNGRILRRLCSSECSIFSENRRWAPVGEVSWTRKVLLIWRTHD